MLKSRKILTMLIIVGMCLSTSSYVKASTVDKKINNIYKVWNIKFNHEIQFNEDTKRQIILKDEHGNLLKPEINIKDNNKTISVSSPKEGYKYGATYNLNIGNKIYSKNSVQLGSEKTLVFKVDSKNQAEEICNYKYKKETKNIIDILVKNIKNKGMTSEWETVGFKQVNEPIPDVYVNLIKNEIKKNKWNFEQILDNERMILGVLASGYDPLNIEGLNLIEKIYTDQDLSDEGINTLIFALISLDSKNYKIPTHALWTREKLVKSILEEQTTDGGWDLAGIKIDPDMTGMALMALAPYTDKPEVKKAIDKAIDKLSKIQKPNGAFASYGIENCESICQVIMGLCANGIDLLDSRFIKNEKTLIDALMKFKLPDGNFCHIVKGRVSNKATEQALEALVAYVNLKEKGQGKIYKF